MSTLQWTVRVLEQSGKEFFLSGTEEMDPGIHHIHADLPSGTIHSIHAEYPLKLLPGDRIFENGYQTWTYCPEYSIHQRIRGLKRIPSFIVHRFKLDRYGDYHFVDYPYHSGITHGMSWCYFRTGKKYQLFASLDEEPGYTLFTYDAKRGMLSIDRDCAGIECGGIYPLFDLIWKSGTEQEVFDAWFSALPFKRLPAEPLYGYSSWYNRYQNISDSSIYQDLCGCKTIFQSGDLFQIDDGWEPFVGDWTSPDPVKFPSGLKPIVSEIHASGFRAGLWLAPFVAETKSSLYRNHQNWFLKVNGENWSCGSNWSGFYSLDLDHPEVQKYLHDVFSLVFNEWGFDFVKLDFLYAAAPFGTRLEPRSARMIRALRFLRNLCGSHPILGCGVPVMPAFGLVEYCRVGCDVGLDWNDILPMRIIHRERVSTKQSIGNSVFRRELNGRAFLSDPDVFFLRKENCRLKEYQKDELATINALLGGVFLTSDDPSSYTEVMRSHYQRYRHLSAAKVLDVNIDHGVQITYNLDGEEKTISFK